MVDREELLTQAQRRYPEFLRSVIEDAAFFPLELLLARLRGEYLQTESILMDLPTLKAHEPLATRAASALPETTTLLPAERAALEYLCAHGLWLEQERIPFAEVVQTFARISPLMG